MKKLLVLYYSRSGNTEKMAKAVAEGAQSDSVQVDLNFHVDFQDLAAYDAIAIGVPTYHHDMPMDYKNLFEEAATKGLSLKGKVAAVFGSYGWSGEAPKLLLEILKNRFGMQVIEPPLITKYAPDTNAIVACKELGKKVSETLMNTP